MHLFKQFSSFATLYDGNGLLLITQWITLCVKLKTNLQNQSCYLNKVIFMTVKKSALYKGNNSKHKHLIEQLEDNSICVTADSTKAQLRLLAKHCGFDYDNNWNTRTLGAKFIDFLHEKDSNSVMLDDNAKKMAIILDKDEQGNLFKHTIEQSANSENENAITVTADSKKAVLRLIFNDMGVAYDNDWNTQTMGAKLIELINNSSDDEYDDEPLESEIIAEKNWEW